MKKNERPKPLTGNQSDIEVLAPNEADRLRESKGMKLLDQVVQQSLAEALAGRDQFVLEPFFRSRQEAYEIRRLQTVPERQSWAGVYEEHGCLFCHKSELPHAACGMCTKCYPMVLQWKRSYTERRMREIKSR